MRIPIILAVVALALAGCNANQGVNPSSQTSSQVWAGHYEETNPYDPTSYAQNQTGRAAAATRESCSDLGIVIARSVNDEAIQGNVRPRRFLDCFPRT